MRIPRKAIESTKEYVVGLHKIKYVYYRDLYETIDLTNFQISTIVDYKRIGINAGDDAIRQFNLIKENNVILYEFTSKTGSKYIATENGDLYRLSNHWGAVASCRWTLEGSGCLEPYVFITGEWELGMANIKDFQVFRPEQRRRRDFILNPEWKKQIAIILPIKEKLIELKACPEFKTRPVKDKQLIGSTLGFISHELKLVKL